MNYFKIKNWDKFQHYKNRQPPWIKLHRELLNNYEFSCLQDASKMHLMMIWLLASQTDNKLPADPAWLKNALHIDSEPDLEALFNAGFIEIDSSVLAACKQSAIVETEAEADLETEAEKDTSKTPPPPFDKIIDLYHKELPELPKVAKLTTKRKGYIRQRWIEDLTTLEKWGNYFFFVSKSDFLMGRTNGTGDRPPFRADIEWLTNPTNFTKIAEDKYHV